MPSQTAMEEYQSALKQGLREKAELEIAGKSGNPAVLDALVPDIAGASTQEVGLLEIPAERIIGTRSIGRITAFTPSFRPLLDANSEFGLKWMNLCDAHLGSTGIRDPILCYEYLGAFYVQEGNKRVSVLRHFGALRIPAIVRRVLPQPSEEPRIIAYYEFLDFFRMTRLYTVQFRRPGDYHKLLTYVGKKPGESWTEAEIRTFNAYYQYFLDAFHALNLKGTDVLPEEALLHWLSLYPYRELGTMTAAELKKTLLAIREDVLSTAHPDTLKMETRVEVDKPGILNRLVSPGLDHLNVAFVHQLTPATSGWALGHENGAEYLQRIQSDRVTVKNYYDANDPVSAEASIAEAVRDGAQVVFTTAPLLRRATLKAAARFPKVRFLNCSVDQPYSSICSYYGRVYEGKFITGAIAGAMAQNDRIGYIASYPIFGVPASINAFALGAQLTNPRAQIELRWSCTTGNHQADFLASGIRVISNRDTPVQSGMYLDFCNYGTYQLSDRGDLIPLASPVWVWGNFYEAAAEKLLNGTWKNEKGHPTNYWLGMDSGVIDLSVSEKLPEGVRAMAGILREGLIDRTIDPFRRRITAQDGTVMSDGSHSFTPDEVLHMDWLCSNVVGSIPSEQELLPMALPMVQELGIYRNRLPGEKEAPHEGTDPVG